MAFTYIHSNFKKCSELYKAEIKSVDNKKTSRAISDPASLNVFEIILMFLVLAFNRVRFFSLHL